MHQYRHILVAIDFSEISEAAAEQAFDLAGHYGAELTFLHVVEHFPEHLPHYRMSGEGMDPQEFLIDRAGKDLDVICERLGGQDINRQVRLTAHSAKAVILDFVREHGIDLIVLGARGRQSIADYIAGSTATGVVRTSPCDVLTIRERK